MFFALHAIALGTCQCLYYRPYIFYIVLFERNNQLTAGVWWLQNNSDTIYKIWVVVFFFVGARLNANNSYLLCKRTYRYIKYVSVDVSSANTRSHITGGETSSTRANCFHSSNIHTASHYICSPWREAPARCCPSDFPFVSCAFLCLVASKIESAFTWTIVCCQLSHKRCQLILGADVHPNTTTAQCHCHTISSILPKHVKTNGYLECVFIV